MTAGLTSEQDSDRRGALAADVWFRGVAYGTLLGVLGALLTIAIGARGDPRLIDAAFVAAIIGAGFGFVVGVLVGLVLGLLVLFGQRTLGVRTVATLMPLAALCVTQPPAVLLALFFSGASMVGLLGLNALCTVLGAWLIGRHYRKAAHLRRVH